MTSTTRRTTDDSNGSGLIGRVAEGVADFSGTARRAIGETAQTLADEAVTRSKQAARAAVREVREHPATTLAMGAAVGVLVAAILMRMRQR
jgi:ElaB/YqjD/DUF883 family membrane-anchored ribosome-binding protein